MVDARILEKKISSLREYLKRASFFKKYNREEFSARPELYDLAERYLHLAAECVIDIGNHIISDLEMRSPEGYRDIFAILSENKIIDDKLSSKLQEWAGYRNILVHNYLKIDHGLSHGIINNDLKYLNQFIKKILRFL